MNVCRRCTVFPAVSARGYCAGCERDVRQPRWGEACCRCGSAPPQYGSLRHCPLCWANDREQHSSIECPPDCVSERHHALCRTCIAVHVELHHEFAPAGAQLIALAAEYQDLY